MLELEVMLEINQTSSLTGQGNWNLVKLSNLPKAVQLIMQGQDSVPNLDKCPSRTLLDLWTSLWIIF